MVAAKHNGIVSMKNENNEIQILVVDDDPYVMLGTSRILKKAGYTVLEAKTGIEGIDAAKSHHPDLIMLDVILPDINGYDVCQTLKTGSETKDILIIMCSGQKVASEDQIVGLEIGADEYITRPVENRVLLSRVKAMLRLRRAETNLKRKEQDLKTIVDGITSELFLLDDEMRIQWANKATIKSLGELVEGVIGHKCYELFAALNGPCKGCPAEKVLKSKTSEKAMVQFPLGKTKQYRGEPIFANDGKLTGVLNIVEDISERIEAQKELAAEKERLFVTLQSIGDGVITTDIQGKIVFLNKVASELTGWTLEEARTKPIEDVFNIVNEHTKKPVEIPVQKVLRAGTIVGLANNTELIAKDGKKRIIADSAAPIFDTQQKIIGTVLVFRDITEIRNMENHLRHVQKMEAIATLAGGVAHEFNNSLVGIMGHIELLKMNLPEGEGRNKSLDRMNTAGHRMSRLTDQLLAYAEGGKYQPKDLKLDAFVIETLLILQHDLSPTVRVETHFAKDISSIRADLAQMQMALSVILANSNEAIEDEGLIRITAENKYLDEGFTNQHAGLKPGPYVCLTIEDDGSGMDEETRKRIFEPFFTTKFQGRGMGMAAVHGIVRNHDGWISVVSELGRGTKIQIYLPAIEIEVEKPKKTKAEATAGTGTILMIEDEDVVIEVTQEMLEMLGYRVMVAKTGKDAIHIAETFDGQIDLALLDIKLPDIDGRNLYPLIMKARSNLKVIVFSGYSIDGPAREILDAGAQDFIQKPFSIATLSEKLKEVFEGK